jgi:hypothetical protein
LKLKQTNHLKFVPLLKLPICVNINSWLFIFKIKKLPFY